MNLFVQIILILFSILLAGLLSAIEIAIASFGTNKIEELKDKDIELVPAFEKIQNNTNLFFGTIQLLNTILIVLSVLIGFLVSNECFAPWLSGSGISYISEHSSVISMIVIISILIFLILVFSLLIPKVIGFKYSDSLGKSSVKILVVLIKIFKFPVVIITKSGNFFLIPFKETTDFSQSRLSEDEIRGIISDGVKSGAIDEAEQKIIDNIFEFTDLKANEVMIPRTEMTAVELIDDSLTLAMHLLQSFRNRNNNSLFFLFGEFAFSHYGKKEIFVFKVITSTSFKPIKTYLK